MSTGGRGRGRGVLALTSFEPCPRPSAKLIQLSAGGPQKQKDLKPSVISEEQKNGEHASGDVRLLAKYNYQAKPDRPGGFDELTIKQGEILTLVQKGHQSTNNPLWWEVKNNEGEIGFAPHNYLQILEDKPSALPWLENKRLHEEEERKKVQKEAAVNGNVGFGAPAPAKVVPYKSAYVENKVTNVVEKYACEVCDKSFNGPQPYKMHMGSKLHREELEYRGL